MPEPHYEVRRSARRRRTMTITREAGRLVVVIPARMSYAEEARIVPPFVERFLARHESRLLPPGDPALQERAERLYAEHLQGAVEGPPPAFTIRWTGRQQRRWGSATPAEGTIRISERVRDLPGWVGDYVIVHELTHLLEANHNRRFWGLVGRYPLTERARGFLDGFSAAQGWGSLPDEDQ